MSAGRQRVLELVAEAAQDLELEVAIVAAGQPVDGDRVRDRAQVVRGDGDADRGAGVEQPARQRLEVAVAVGLDLEHRRRPAVLARLDELVVPVGALDEPDLERRRALDGRGPLEQPVELLRASRAGRPAARARLTARSRTPPRERSSSTSSSTASRESSDSMSMWRWAPRSRARREQWPQACGRVAAPDLGSIGAQHRRQRRDLHRDVRARQRPDAVVLEDRAARPAPGGGRELLERLRGSGPRSGRPRLPSRWPRPAGRPSWRRRAPTVRGARPAPRVDPRRR